MCHRYTVFANPEEIAISLHPDLLIRVPFWAQDDLFPLANVPVVRLTEDAEWELSLLQWGLLPFWWKAKSPDDRPTPFQRKTFNARSETLHSKPSYRAAFKQRRCLIPATEFFEGPKGHAAYFRLKESPLMYFAGLWERCRMSNGDEIESCTIVTTGANELVARYHPKKRMPVILTDETSQERWMSPDIVEREALEYLFEPIPADLMAHREVD